MRAILVVAALLAGCTSPNPDFLPPNLIVYYDWDLGSLQVPQVESPAPDEGQPPPADLALRSDLSHGPDLSTTPDMATVDASIAVDMAPVVDLATKPDMAFDRGCVGHVCPAKCATPQQEWACCVEQPGVKLAIRAPGSSCVDNQDCGVQRCAAPSELCMGGTCCLIHNQPCTSDGQCCFGKCLNQFCQ